MLAKEPEAALKLAARAETAAGKSDPKITRNIAMIRSMAPQAPAPATIALATPPQAPAVHNQTGAAPQAPAPATIALATPPQAPAVHNQTGAAPQAGKPLPQAPQAHDNRVVMQRVPVDPQAGPVQTPKPAPVNTATQGPRPLQPQVADAAHVEPHAEAPRPFSSQPLPPPAASVKAAGNKQPAAAAAAPVKAAPV